MKCIRTGLHVINDDKTKHACMSVCTVAEVPLANLNNVNSTPNTAVFCKEFNAVFKCASLHTMHTCMHTCSALHIYISYITYMLLQKYYRVHLGCILNVDNAYITYTQATSMTLVAYGNQSLPCFNTCMLVCVFVCLCVCVCVCV